MALPPMAVAPGPAEAAARVLTPEALDFLAGLHETFEPRRQEILARRAQVAEALGLGLRPSPPPETVAIRRERWTVALAPPDLVDRRVELTGPAEAEAIARALNSGARVFVADFDDALCPTWENLLAGQEALIEAVGDPLRRAAPEPGRTATLMIRPRGWHLEEPHLRVGDRAISASLFDFGLFLFHNARALQDRGSGPYVCLSKLEGYREARLWDDVFRASEARLSLPPVSIKASVLIETVPAAFEMEEILYALRDHIVGLNAGRRGYLFSVIKKFGTLPGFILPDRATVTMTLPFLRAYTDRLVDVCHRRGAHAIGDMAAWMPGPADPALNERACQAVGEDKRREAEQGFDGTWVAHPGLVPVAQAAFDRVLGGRPHQTGRRVEGAADARALLDVRVPEGRITRAGVEQNVAVALRFLEAWLSGQGVIVLRHRRVDAATAEIARAQLWQWVRHRVALADGGRVDGELVRGLLAAEMARIEEEIGPAQFARRRYGTARALLEEVTSAPRCPEFLTLAAYPHLDARSDSRHHEEV